METTIHDKCIGSSPITRNMYYHENVIVALRNLRNRKSRRYAILVSGWGCQRSNTVPDKNKHGTEGADLGEVSKLFPDGDNPREMELFQCAARIAALLPPSGADALRVLQLAEEWLNEFLAS